MEEELVLLLETLCPRVSPDFAPLSTKKPYITWQAIGGRSVIFTANTAADKENTLIQINVWAASRKAATQLMREVEDELLATTLFLATPEGRPVSTAEEDLGLYGSIQTFSVWSTR